MIVSSVGSDVAGSAWAGSGGCRVGMGDSIAKNCHAFSNQDRSVSGCVWLACRMRAPSDAGVSTTSTLATPTMAEITPLAPARY